MNVIYTYNLSGNITFFPRLFTHVRTLLLHSSPKPLLLDLGGACHPDQWHCKATEGRSALIILDAMGYDAANTYGVLSKASYDKLKEHVIMTLIHDEQPHIVKNVLLALTPISSTGSWMPKICLTPCDSTIIQDGWLHLARIAGDEIGIVQMDSDTMRYRVEKIPANTMPDPIISGVVDLVLAEARLYVNKLHQG